MDLLNVAVHVMIDSITSCGLAFYAGNHVTL